MKRQGVVPMAGRGRGLVRKERERTRTPRMGKGMGGEGTGKKQKRGGEKGRRGQRGGQPPDLIERCTRVRTAQDEMVRRKEIRRL